MLAPNSDKKCWLFEKNTQNCWFFEKNKIISCEIAFRLMRNKEIGVHFEWLTLYILFLQNDIFYHERKTNRSTFCPFSFSGFKNCCCTNLKNYVCHQICQWFESGIFFLQNMIWASSWVERKHFLRKIFFSIWKQFFWIRFLF